MSNPINAFGIIKRTHKESLKKLNLESSNSIINLQKANRSLMEFINDAPAVEDFYAATESIALIQVRKYVQFLFTLQKKKRFLVNLKPRDMLQNLLCLWKKKTHVVFLFFI